MTLEANNLMDTHPAVFTSSSSDRVCFEYLVDVAPLALRQCTIKPIEL